MEGTHEDSLLRFSPPLLSMFGPAVGSPTRHRSRSAVSAGPTSRVNRIVGVETELSLSEIRRNNQLRAEADRLVAQMYTPCPVEDSASSFNCDPRDHHVSEENRSVRVIVASTDVDDSQTYLEMVSFSSGQQNLQNASMTSSSCSTGNHQKKLLLAMFPGRRDIVHASVSSVGPSGEVLILFTERQGVGRARASSPKASSPTHFQHRSSPPAASASEEFKYQLFICAVKAPAELLPVSSGLVPSFATSQAAVIPPSSGAPGLPLTVLDITPEGSRQGNGKPAYPVAYFITSEEKKAVQTFLVASDNTEVGLCLQQAQFTVGRSHSTIRIVMHEKWSLARNQFWHQWDPHRQQVMFAAHCVQFIKFRMIALDGNPDRRLPLFERNVKPQSLHVHQGSVLPVPYAAANSTPSSASSFVVLPIRYECGTEDYALCSQIIRKGKYVRHTNFASQVVVTVTLLRNGLKEGRIYIDVPFKIRSRRHGTLTQQSEKRGGSISTKVFMSENPHPSDLIVDDSLDGMEGMETLHQDDFDTNPHSARLREEDQHHQHQERNDGDDEDRVDHDEEWRVCFAYVRGMIAIILPRGQIHFVDVAHKERCPTYLFGSSEGIFLSTSSVQASSPTLPLSENLMTENGSMVSVLDSGLQSFRQAVAACRDRGQTPVLAALPVPIPNIIFLCGTTAAVSLDLHGHALWRYIGKVLHHRRTTSNYQLLLHAAVHVATTHIPPRADGYSLNYLLKLLLDSPHVQQQQADGRREDQSATSFTSAGCILGPDVLTELLLGECYGRVRSKARTGGCQLHLMLPIADDGGILEKQEELFATLRLSSAASRIIREHRRAKRKLKLLLSTDASHRRSQNLRSGGADASHSLETQRLKESNLVQLEKSGGAVSLAQPSSSTILGQGPGNAPPAARPAEFNQRLIEAESFLFPKFRFHQMLFHIHTHPPLPDVRQEEQLERPYSYGTVCAPASKDVKDECSLTSDRWWARHVITAAPSGLFQRIFSSTLELPIQRISFRKYTRDCNVPFANYMETLLQWHSVPLAEARRLVSMYMEEMESLLDDIVEVVSQPPHVLHPHKQILFLLNLCAALDVIQFPWKGPLRHRVAKLVLQHIPRCIMVAGIKSRTVPVELDEVIVSFRSVATLSPWVEQLVKEKPAAQRHRERAASCKSTPENRRKKAAQQRDDDVATTTSSATSDRDVNDERDAENSTKRESSHKRRVPTTLDYHKRERFAQRFVGQGVMNCAKDRIEQNRFIYGTMASCCSLNRTATPFDDFDKQSVMLELFPHSSMQFYRNQLPLDGFIPNYLPLRSFANWKVAVEAEGPQARRMQAPRVDIATTRDIKKPETKNYASLDKDVLSHKRRLVADALTTLMHPMTLLSLPNHNNGGM